MPINETYQEDTIVEAIATALDSFYKNLIYPFFATRIIRNLFKMGSWRL